MSLRRGHVRFPSEEVIPRPTHGERVVHYDFITRGLAFPVHHFLRSLLLAYGFQLHNLSPNSYLHIACFVTLCECFLGINPHLGLWKKMFTIQRQGKDEIECVDIKTHANAKFFNLRVRESFSRWKSRWFYVMDLPAEGRGFSLPEFSTTSSVKKTTTWSHKLGETEGEEAETLMD